VNTQRLFARPALSGVVLSCPPYVIHESQLEHFRTRLLEERERVTRDLARYHAQSQVSLRDQSGALSTAPGEMGTDTEDQEIDAANAARQSLELEEIDAALERLYQRPDEYGRCEKTGDQIPYERLDLIPWARTC